jgi:prepilin-type N-terminal cleavage/methylation domain-containing protein
MEPTYRAKISKIFSQKGFSLFEVLAVIVLIGIMSTMGYRMISGQSGKDQLDEFKDEISRTVNFATSEAIIRNRVIRLILHLDKTPQTYSIEMASTTQLLLPEKSEDNTSLENLDDEELKKEKEKFNQNFLPHPEGKEKDFSIDIQIIGTGLLENKKLQHIGDFSTFFYPSGEKDPAIFIVASKDELMALSYDSFRDRLHTKYYPQEAGEPKDIAEKIFNDWKP